MLKKSHPLTLAEWDALQAAMQREEVVTEIADRIKREADSRVWDDPKNWR